MRKSLKVLSLADSSVIDAKAGSPSNLLLTYTYISTTVTTILSLIDSPLPRCLLLLVEALIHLTWFWMHFQVSFAAKDKVSTIRNKSVPSFLRLFVSPFLLLQLSPCANKKVADRKGIKHTTTMSIFSHKIKGHFKISFIEAFRSFIRQQNTLELL